MYTLTHKNKCTYTHKHVRYYIPWEIEKRRVGDEFVAAVVVIE